MEWGGNQGLWRYERRSAVSDGPKRQDNRPLLDVMDEGTSVTAAADRFTEGPTSDKRGGRGILCHSMGYPTAEHHSMNIFVGSSDCRLPARQRKSRSCTILLPGRHIGPNEEGVRRISQRVGSSRLSPPSGPKEQLMGAMCVLLVSFPSRPLFPS